MDAAEGELESLAVIGGNPSATDDAGVSILKVDWYRGRTQALRRIEAGIGTADTVDVVRPKRPVVLLVAGGVSPVELPIASTVAAS